MLLSSLLSVAFFLGVRVSATTILFENDGNWTTFESKPSALFINTPASEADAKQACDSQNETLLAKASFSSFQSSFSYQQYLGAIDEDQLFWSSSGAVNSHGVVSNNTNTTLPYLCTNSAPMVTGVVQDFSFLPRVNTSLNGTTYEGLRDHMQFRFVGIPFAQPPVGDLRFQKAVALNETAEYVNATEYSATCTQIGYFETGEYNLNPSPKGVDEDCLYLNVYTPYLPATNQLSTKSKLKPVMVWYFGGGDIVGSANDLTFDGASLTSRSDVVVVTVMYRVNIFGYLTLNDGVITGNQALSDQVQGLRWVKQHIEAFGGDPDNISIFGQSAGGGAVSNIISTPKIYGENLVQNAIAASTRNNVYEAADLAEQALPYINQLCPNTTGTTRLSCLQEVNATTLLDLSGNVAAWQPAIDGEWVIDFITGQWALGPQYVNNVSLMAGFMHDEWQAIAATALTPNMNNLTEAVLYNLTATGAISTSQAEEVLQSGIWLVSNQTFNNGSTGYTDVYNATIAIGTQAGLVCPGITQYQVAAAARAFSAQWMYFHRRAYIAWYDDYYNLCTFPVGEPDTPYYVCHAGDLLEIFGTYYIFDEPIRVPEDIYYTNAVQDMFAWFARTGNPNVEASYLRARNYTTTERFLDQLGAQWPQFTVADNRFLSFQYPNPEIITPPFAETCNWVEQFQTYFGDTF